MVWKLNTADLLQLRGGGGERFVHFMDCLIRAEGASGGLNQAAIATQLRANIKDGGVDTEVRDRIPEDKSGWFPIATCWQYKAVDAKDIDDRKKTKKNDLQKEINKPDVKKLIGQGYAFRFCLLGDLTPQKTRDWEAQLKKDSQAINPEAPDPRVIHGGHLLEWAERFPATVAWLRQWTHGGFHWEAWRDNCRAVTRTYVANPAWEAVRQQVLQHACLSGPTVGGEPCLSIGGAAGVGKTRLVFETLNELPEAPGLVLYLADEKEAKATATAIVNTPGQTAVLVADECGSHTRHFLNENLRGHINRIRVICLDNTGERLASATGQIWLTADSLTNTEAVLTANFPNVPEERRRHYTRFAKGFVRFAADMCRHDAQLASGDMSKILESAEQYVRKRLGNHLSLVAAIGLFHKVGFKDDVSAELDALCSLTGCSKQQFTDSIRTVRESPGFVVQAGRYWYVTPEIVAPVLFAEGWQRWLAADLRGFLERLPQHLQQQLLDRAATHGAKEVRDQIGTFFRGWFSELTARDLADPTPTSLAAALVEVSPDEYLPQLRAVIEAAEPGELRDIQGHALGAKWGPRRTLVWLLERLASFPEFFEDCEACLFRLALEESEPQIGNNASAIWANLFAVDLSGTATPFQKRLPYLQKRTASPVVAEARLGFNGLAKALYRAEGHVLGEPVVAGRIRPEDWQPSSASEERACYRSALEICGQRLNDGLPDHHQLAFAVLADSLYFLLRIGLADDLRRIITPKNLGDDEARKLLQVVDDFLEHEQKMAAAGANELAVAYIRGVQEWSNLFRPSDFAGRLRSVCARALWDRRFVRDVSKDKDETDELAALIVQKPKLLAPQLGWLASAEAQSAERLGFALGRIDLAGDCGRMIFQYAIARKPSALLRGYIRGMVYAQRLPTAEYLALMTQVEASHPESAIDILISAGDSFDALNRILRLVDSQKVSVTYLSNLATGLGRRDLTAEEVNRLIPYFTRASESGDADAARAGVMFLETYLLFESRHSKESCLTSDATRSLAWQLVESALLSITGYNGTEWLEIVKKLATFDADRAARLLSRALLADNFALREESEKELTELARAHPECVMDAFGSVLLDSEHGWLLQTSELRDLVSQIPAKVVLTWVREHGIDSARAIARHLPLPRLNESGDPIVPEVLDTIFCEYDDDEVFFNFLGGSHSGEVWWGNGAEQFRRQAENAKKFLNHPNPRIREWARMEISHRHHLAELEDREHEERFLPS